MEAIGDWEDDRLVGLIVWRKERDPAVRHRFGDQVWTCVTLAVDVAYRRQHRAQRLKELLLEEAAASGVKFITSLVHWDNAAIFALNRQLNGSILKVPGLYGPDREFGRCIVPIPAIGSAPSGGRGLQQP